MASSLLERVLGPRVMLTEGRSDAAFFLKLIESRALPEFCLPFHPDDDLRREGGPNFFGRDGFENMFRALSGIFKLSPNKRREVRGILVATDATDTPELAFQHVRRQIATVGGFPLPSRAGETVAGVDGWPAVCIILVPGDRPGGLETLCYSALSAVKLAEAECVAQFLRCAPTRPDLWGSRETR